MNTTPDWPFLPQLTQIYVGDVDSVLAQAMKRGVQIVTRPTDFFGTAFSRMIDPRGNMWWVYQHGEAPELDWDSAEDETDLDSAGWSDPDLAFIHRTLMEAIPPLGTEPIPSESRGNSGALSTQLTGPLDKAKVTVVPLRPTRRPRNNDPVKGPGSRELGMRILHGRGLAGVSR